MSDNNDEGETYWVLNDPQALRALGRTEPVRSKDPEEVEALRRKAIAICCMISVDRVNKIIDEKLAEEKEKKKNKS